MFCLDNYQEVLNFAAKAHKEQKTPKGLPYLTHITNVAVEVLNASIKSKLEKEKINFAITCALLHDVLEDTDVTYDDLYVKYSDEVADGVEALSKNKKLEKKEQMRDSIERILTQSYEVQMVKLADRVVNLSTPPKQWDSEKIKAYYQESKFILSCLSNANIYLAQRLKDKIKAYEEYL